MKSAGKVPKVGDLYVLTRHGLGNPAGTLGVCYEVYKLDGCPGYSFIFANGGYDGFSPSEVNMFLIRIGRDESVADYEFTNVMKLTEDFDNGRLGVVSQGPSGMMTIDI